MVKFTVALIRSENWNQCCKTQWAERVDTRIHTWETLSSGQLSSQKRSLNVKNSLGEHAPRPRALDEACETLKCSLGRTIVARLRRVLSHCEQWPFRKFQHVTYVFGVLLGHPPSNGTNRQSNGKKWSGWYQTNRCHRIFCTPGNLAPPLNFS